MIIATVIAWDHTHHTWGPGTAKLLRLDRDDIDEGSDEMDCAQLIWIDSAGVRREDITLDHAYNRWPTAAVTVHMIDELLSSAPDDAKETVANLRRFA